MKAFFSVLTTACAILPLLMPAAGNAAAVCEEDQEWELNEENDHVDHIYTPGCSWIADYDNPNIGHCIISGYEVINDGEPYINTVVYKIYQDLDGVTSGVCGELCKMYLRDAFTPKRIVHMC